MPATQVGRGSKRRKLAADINIVPYIDVMLVLLVIFMVTAPLLTQGISVKLPRTAAQPIHSSEEPVTLFVDARGHYFLDVGSHPKEPLNGAQVTKEVSKVLKARPDAMILIRADKSVPYARVAEGMAFLQAAGASRIGFVTRPPGFEKNRKTSR